MFAWLSIEGLHIVDLQQPDAPARLIPVPKAVDFSFSSKSSYISTFERLQKTPDGQPDLLNLSIWSCRSGQRLSAFTHKNPDTWRVQWTDDESCFGRMVGTSVHFHDIRDPVKPSQKLQLDGLAGFSISPGKNPCVAVFIPERKGQPAIVRLYGLNSFKFPLSNKSFFKAEEIEFKWNSIGTNVLVLTRTIADKTGKSYYGETNLYYLSAVGNYDCRVALDETGPVHDISWGPGGSEFVVVYGNVPNAKAALFDSRANKIFDFGASAKNFCRYSPKGRLLLLAGFGNLPGYIEIWDRQHLVKLSTFKEDSAVYCEFTPEGTDILTATLSPRLRVDNRFTIRNYKGEIRWRQEFKELFSVAIRPGALYENMSRENSTEYSVVSDAVAQVKKAAYVPPHLRNAQTSIGKQTSGSSTAAPTAANGVSEADKQIKIIERKLKQITQLKERQSAGEQLEKNQLDKITHEQDLLDQLSKLKL